MDSLQEPLNRLVEALQWFAVNGELKLLHVLTDVDLRMIVLEHIAGAEHDSLNTSPFFVLEAPFDRDDDGWDLRAAELREDWEELRTTLAGAEPTVELNELPGSSLWTTSLERFGAVASAALLSLRQPLEGLVLVLSPAWVADPERWADDLNALLRQEALARVRFIVVDLDAPMTEPLCRDLGPRAESVDARLSPESAQREMAAMLQAMSATPPDATGPRAVGAAGPRVAPPPRKDQPPPISVEERRAQLAEAGVPEVLADPELCKDLRLLVLTSGQALAQGDPARAVELQRRARDLCFREQSFREGITLELLLGSSLLQAGALQGALETFRDAKAHAERGGFFDLAIQAQLALASALLLEKRPLEAASAAEEAGLLGEAHDQPLLAIEAYRLSGQILASEQKLQPAVDVWKRALALADAAPPELVSASSAPQVAKAMAELCRDHGLTPQAESLESQSLQLEEISEQFVGESVSMSIDEADPTQGEVR